MQERTEGERAGALEACSPNGVSPSMDHCSQLSGPLPLEPVPAGGHSQAATGKRQRPLGGRARDGCRRGLGQRQGSHGEPRSEAAFSSSCLEGVL